MPIYSIEGGYIKLDDVNELVISCGSEESFMNNMKKYIIYITIEDMRRNEQFYMPEKSLPTLKNIFDKRRAIEMSNLN